MRTKKAILKANAKTKVRIIAETKTKDEYLLSLSAIFLNYFLNPIKKEVPKIDKKFPKE
jgi:hypothetical protein